jgi:hypothetical protein
MPTAHIGLVFTHGLAHCCGILRGVHRYARAKPDWALLPFTPEPRALAEQAGFSDPRQLSVVFRPETGLTPTAYRRLHRG